MNLPIPLAVLYAGLGGTLLALIVATAQNRWSAKVFFLLALRLAIGWHFLFEGLYKLNSHLTGPTEANPRTFSSEPYFRVAPGPIGAYMRKQFVNPDEVFESKLKPLGKTSPEEFKQLDVNKQADACPPAVAEQLNAIEKDVLAVVKAEAAKELKAAEADRTKAFTDIAAAEAKGTREAKSDDDKAKVKTKADADRAAAVAKAKIATDEANKKAETAEAIAQLRLKGARASYARWVYGADARPTKVKYFANDVPLSALQRLEFIEWLRKEVKALEWHTNSLGNGYGIDQKRSAELRTDLVNAELDLVRDTKDFIAELKKDLNGGKAVSEPPETRPGDTLDKVTMWFLIGVGACLMAGLFTRLACLMAAGFLVVTYLAHPAFPWYPLPPNTEGNPVFINKNVIECIALLALACMPTGRWLGLDAIVLRPFCRYKPEGQQTT